MPVERAADHTANHRDRLGKLGEAALPRLRQQLHSDALVDLDQGATRHLFHRRLRQLRAEVDQLWSMLTEDLLNR